MEVKDYLAQKGNKDCTELVKELLDTNEKLEVTVSNLAALLEAESALLKAAVKEIEDLENKLAAMEVFF